MVATVREDDRITTHTLTATMAIEQMYTSTYQDSANTNKWASIKLDYMLQANYHRCFGNETYSFTPDLALSVGLSIH